MCNYLQLWLRQTSKKHQLDSDMKFWWSYVDGLVKLCLYSTIPWPIFVPKAVVLITWILGGFAPCLVSGCTGEQRSVGNSYSWWFQKSQETSRKARHENSPQIINFLSFSVGVGDGCVFLWSRRAVTNWLYKDVSIFPFDLADVCRKHGFFRFIQEFILPSKKGHITISIVKVSRLYTQHVDFMVF